ncbi:MAG TPA: hypothetical protein VFU23_12255 [Gemmatimonadales bacterium]|nr:hypothetical protein [Gemmatimonadales bacterium]
MRTALVLSLLLLGASGPSIPLAGQTPAKPATPVKKPPSKLKQIAKKVADSAATTAAGMAVDTLLGQKGRALAGQLTGTAAAVSGACPPGSVAVPVGAGAAGMDPAALAALAGTQKSAGAAVVSAAKQAIKKPVPAAAAAAAAPPAGIICQPVAAGAASPGAPGAAAVAAASAPGGMPGGVGALAAVTPVGMAVAAAPMAGQAVKGLKGMFGKKPMDKIAILRELGKGRLELKGAKFIEGTAELEPGFEAEFAALGEALPLSEGTYILHVAAEEGEKGAAPDTALARKRIEKAWAALLVNGVPDQKVIAVGVLPPEMQKGRKAPKRGDARIEFIRLPNQP